MYDSYKGGGCANWSSMGHWVVTRVQATFYKKIVQNSYIY